MITYPSCVQYLSRQFREVQAKDDRVDMGMVWFRDSLVERWSSKDAPRACQIGIVEEKNQTV